MSTIGEIGLDKIATKTKHNAKAILIVSLMLLALLLPTFMGLGVRGVHNDGLFELGDGTDPGTGTADIDDDAPPECDWDSLFDATPTQAEIDAAVTACGGAAGVFIADDSSQGGASDRSTFSGAGGSNKNNDPITPPGDTWHWDFGNVPAKDDLSNVYAYATVDSNNHLIIYSGFERLDPSGDSHIDVELFQDDVSLVGDTDGDGFCDTNTADNHGGCHFSGIRTIGDTIVSMDFVQGGALGEVHVRKWDGTSYVQVAALGSEGCNTPFSGHPADIICAFNNGSPIPSGDWPTFDRHGDTITSVPKNAFSEFGFDATELVGDVCFTTIMGKTRSSQSFTAELKDFAGPSAFNICGANIKITPDDVNEVGETHTFFVEVNKKLGGIESPADDGTIVTVTLTGTNGAVPTNIVDNCISPGTVGGTCSVSFTSFTAGTVTGHAEADVLVGSLVLHVETGAGEEFPDATKKFVSAFITITPSDTNSVGELHTFTINVMVNASDGSVNPAPDGTVVLVTLTPSGGAVPKDVVDTCASPGTMGGTCTVTFTSDKAGTVVGHASVDLVVEGVPIHRQTDGVPANSGDATKVFVSGSIRWTKVDNADQLQGGATFEVCRTHNFNTDTLVFDDISDVCVSVLDNSPPDEDPDAGEFLLSGLRLGRYTVRETLAPPGFVPDPDTVTVELTFANPDVVISEPFGNERPILKLSEFGYTNQPSGTPTSGVVSGTTTFTLKLKNFGTASTTYTGSLTVSVVGEGAGSLSCPDSPLAIGGSLTPGEEDMFSLTCTYTNLADGAVITANLSAVTYTVNSLTRTASGTPASISFTIQSD